MPGRCPCGGEYMIVKHGNEVSLMHSKPACHWHLSMSAGRYLEWLREQGVAVPIEVDPHTEPPRPNRKHRRALEARARRGRRR